MKRVTLPYMHVMVSALLGFAVVLTAASARDVERLSVDRPAPASVIILGDGTAGWESQTVDALIQNFVAQFGSDVPLQLMRFDIASDQQTPCYVDENTVRSTMLRPRMPMRDALITALSATEARSRNRQAIVVLASQEFYPSLLTKGQVISAARQPEVPVYSIVLRRPAEAESSFLRLFMRTLSVVPVWLVESVLDEDRSPTTRETSGLLQGLANATGGRMYSATGSEDAKAYVTAIAAEIRTVVR